VVKPKSADDYVGLPKTSVNSCVFIAWQLTWLAANKGYKCGTLVTGCPASGIVGNEQARRSLYWGPSDDKSSWLYCQYKRGLSKINYDFSFHRNWYKSKQFNRF